MGTAMTAVELKSDFKVTLDTPYLALMGELRGLYPKDLGENLPPYNCTTLYNIRIDKSDALFMVGDKYLHSVI